MTRTLSHPSAIAHTYYATRLQFHLSVPRCSDSITENGHNESGTAATNWGTEKPSESISSLLFVGRPSGRHRLSVGSYAKTAVQALSVTICAIVLYRFFIPGSVAERAKGWHALN